MGADTIRRQGPVVERSEGDGVLVGVQLGWLYLEQGHLAEAEEVFEAVLCWRTDDTEAQRGLKAARRQVSRVEVAEAVVAEGLSGDRPILERPGLRRRKIAKLDRYLRLVRRYAGASDDVAIG